MIKEKRQSLEKFIAEQTFGPGVSGFRFVSIENEALLSKDFSSLQPIDYKTELINTVPAGVYSTGILFPENKSSEAVFEEKEEIEEDETSPGGKEDDQASIEDDEAIRIDQMFPNSMGFTCCLTKSMSFEDLEIKLKARYYVKLNRKDPEFNEKYGVLCECDSENLKKFLENNSLNDFRVKSINTNNVLLSNKLDSESIKELRKKVKGISQDYANKFSDQAKELKIPFLNVHLSSIKQSCYYEIRNNCHESDVRHSIYNLSQRIEEIENYISHINDIISLNDSRSYGLWQSKQINEIIKFPEKVPTDFRGKMIYSYNKFDSLKNIWRYNLQGSFARLSANLQLSKDTRRKNENIFLKVQLVNTSTPFEKEENDSRYFSGFNEVVNQRSFFGVSLNLASNHLVPYNFNENQSYNDINEDLTTKFIYRQYKDYGIGHGCSVKWNFSDSTKTIGTTYIPVCDTPDVDPTPKRKDFDNDLKAFPSSSIKTHFQPTSFLNSTKALEFKWLSNFSNALDGEIIEGLKGFINNYKEWIEIKRGKYKEEIEPTKLIVEHQLADCESDYLRMFNNIKKYLEGPSNKDNLLSFRLMNGAMFMQMWHAQNIKKKNISKILKDGAFSSFDEKFYKEAKDDFFTKGASASWRAFQLAFILLNLDGIFREDGDPMWEARNQKVDLVWFPTGGGKTEAYLGIIALTIINRRRLHKRRGGGTAAIMRYTLRLLTLQQFQRATLMIMALELIRRWKSFDLGDEPIFIGLWVGNDSLPNKFDGDDGLIREFQKLAAKQKSKVPFTKCPWCNSELNIPHTPFVIPERENTYQYNRLPLYCDEVKCSFSMSPWGDEDDIQGPIPVSLCDEEIYQHPPALLFGTVDKFAQLAHKVSSKTTHRNKDSRRLFGQGNWERNKPQNGYIPPDLIIQDELHLLLGPLGSAVALFESAVDQLCTREDGTRPKVISSTATTRNTGLQIMALFDRTVNLFPKPGVECDDSFFAFYKRQYNDKADGKSRYISKRRYLGFLPTGRTQIWMQMRLAAILMTHRAVFELQKLGPNHPVNFEAYDKEFIDAMDYYHTIISYFNSLKEVGKTESQVQSYILKEIRRVFYRRLRPGKLMDAFYTYSINSAELTGRLSGEEVKNQLDRVEQKWSPSKRIAFHSEDDCVRGTPPPDFLVATNMISVGIDVSRFNTIIMNSMPRNIAEYIQASSRVARDKEGLVLTIHHPFRARDVSHYEKFIEFHEKMYSYVEPISITPFTKKAVDRYLGLYLATILRHTTEFVDREDATNISVKSDQEVKDLINSFIDYFENRKERLQMSSVLATIKNLLKEDNIDSIRNWIEEAILEWQCFVRNNSRNSQVVFSRVVNSQEQLYVDIDEYQENIQRGKWKIPMSLRVIEPSAGLKINQK